MRSTKSIKLWAITLTLTLIVSCAILVHYSPLWLTGWAISQYDGHDRLWAHRVNTLDRLKQASQIFSGVELDLVFMQEDTETWFDVSHPPDNPTGLRLNTYLSEVVRLNSKIGLWLDIKNLNAKNKSAVLERLRELIATHGLQDNTIIIESQDYHSLPHISEGGLYTSYYISHQSPKDLAINIALSEASAISYPGDMYRFVVDKVRPIAKGQDMLTWRTDLRASNPIDALSIREMLSDKDIKVMLIRFRSP